MAKFESMQSVFRSNLKPRARLVLQCLVLHCNQAGECFPSIKTIAAECGYGISTIKRALDELLEAGYIQKAARFDRRKNGGQTSNLYTLCASLPESPAPVPEQTVPDIQDAPMPTADTHSTPRDTCVHSYSFAEGMSRRVAHPDMGWGAVHIHTPLNLTVEQNCTCGEKSIRAGPFFKSLPLLA